MAQKKQKPEGSHLRILSIAYATGRLDRETYLRLRTRQLGALEFAYGGYAEFQLRRWSE
jgi:hypothetical protein